MPKTAQRGRAPWRRIKSMASPMTLGLSARGESDPERGTAILAEPLLNKGTAFTERERDALGIRPLLPPRVFTMEEQVQRTLSAVRRKQDNIEKYIYLTNLQNRNEMLFYRLVIDQHRGDGAAHLHADSRGGLPPVRLHLPAPARPLHQRSGSGGASRRCSGSGRTRASA